MKQSAIAPAPYFDPEALRTELEALYEGSDNPEDCRSEVLRRLKKITQEARKAAQAQLLLDGDGTACAEGLSYFQDELIRLIFGCVKHHVCHSNTADFDTEQMAIVAIGGYGRGMLAPYSDIDLLFLLPYKQTPLSESTAEYILYLLWDLGFKVGHAARNIKQCITLSRQDFTIRTSLLDSRLISGDAELYEKFQTQFRKSVITGTAREFIEKKMAERKDRHKRAGETCYRVEPNIKDGKGGLRDLHTLHWLIKYVYGQCVGEETLANSTFKPQEAATFKRCNGFLWTVRCHLHFEAGRAEERLSFGLQPSIAANLKYREANGLRAVERFMRHYFLVTREVGELTAILCSNLEIQQLVSAPRLTRIFDGLNQAISSQVSSDKEFRIDHGRLNVADPNVFKRDPLNLIRIFLRAEQTRRFLHPEAICLIRHSSHLINEQVRTNAEANRIFLELLCSKTRSEASLRRMNEAGVLGKFIPEFGLVVSMMQFNMYHHFTVDEHLLRTVGQLSVIENGELAEILPLSTTLIASLKKRRVLHVAAFLHDIGKGRPEDHSIVGAEIAADLCPRFGLSKAETEIVCWLVRNHLTMSDIAFRRDLSDPKTIRDFAELVDTQEHLNLLLLLTVIDIRAVGPGTWNSWKGQLLRELYYETTKVISSGPITTSPIADERNSKDKLRERLASVAPDVADDFIQSQYPEYWLRTDTDKQVQHAKLLRQFRQSDDKIATSFSSDPFKGITKLTLLAPDHPSLLAVCAGCCSAAGAEIICAEISTTRDGFAFDTFLLQRSFEDDEDEKRRFDRIGEMIIKVLRGEAQLDMLLKRRRVSEQRIHAFHVDPEVAISNSISDRFTVIEVSARDRPGLLYDLTSRISELNLNITSARITSYGAKVIGVFYTTDLTKGKIYNPDRERTICQRLKEVIQTEETQTA